MQSLGLHVYPPVSKTIVNVVLGELENDPSDWWLPKSTSHDIFERAWMKFVSGNLNYFDFNNMLNLAEEDPRNPAYTRTYRVCEALRASLRFSLNHAYGPFGRMNLWKVPPKAFIKPHRDDFQYHRCITRFVVSLNLTKKDTEVVIDKTAVPLDACGMFQFLPATQEHSFKNNSTVDWFFLAFDLWDFEKYQLFAPIKRPSFANKYLE